VRFSMSPCERCLASRKTRIRSAMYMSDLPDYVSIWLLYCNAIINPTRLYFICIHTYSTFCTGQLIDRFLRWLLTPCAMEKKSPVWLNQNLAERFGRWLLVQRYSPITRRLYATTVGSFSGYLGRRLVTTTTHLDVQNFLAERAERGASPRTLRNDLYSLRIFFDFLNLGGLVKWVPPRMVQASPLEPYVPEVLTQKQVNSLLHAARTTHERALLEVLYGTGCRTGELRLMRVQDIDFHERRIRVRGKSGTRFVMFTGPVSRALQNYLAGRKAGYVFIEARPLQNLCPKHAPSGGWRCRWKKYDEKGNRIGFGNGFIRATAKMNYQQALGYFSRLARFDRIQRPLGIRPLCNSAIQKAVQKVGLRVAIRVNPYAFRHTFATHLLDNGADIRIIQEILGHASIRSTQVYTHVSKKMVQRTFDACHPRGR
jgi:site-specific recombinase XerD